MTLQQYLDRLENTLRSRRDITLDHLDIRRKPEEGLLTARVRFFDGSLLGIVEQSEPKRVGLIEKIHYSYHYQSASDELIFRYDNSPHYPDLPSFPSHKHTPDGVIAAEAPDLAAVLHEIDALLYADS